MPRKKRQRIQVYERTGTVFLDMGPIEIWDGADLALLRETVNQVVQRDQKKSLAFQMEHVKYIPSGFFGMLLDCFDQGVQVLLLAPNSHVTGMLWFQQFFAEQSFQVFQLHNGPDHEVPHDQPLPWAGEEDQEIWDANQAGRSLVGVYQKG